ncbi:hypothetical protein [Reyranella sp.]|uniref:hypothetical protein n=1 Tax=Reyranella sp. TaxID=1929291 RepID=UPI003BAC5BD0
MKTTIEPRDRTDEWIARVVPGKSFMDIGGIGHRATNERVTFAHRVGARSCAMADIMPTTYFEWDLFRQKCALLGLPAFREVGDLDIRSRESLTRLGQVDVVYSTGILYHLASPPDALWALRAIVGEHLITNTITFPGKVTNEFGTVALPDCGVVFLPAMTEAERRVIGKHYQDRFGAHPGWKDIDHMSPRPDHREAPQYVEDGELSCGPNWFFYSDNAFRALLRVCRFEILDEYKWRDHTLQLLCRPVP